MELKTAQAMATAIIARLAPYCSRIQVAGSIRRKASNPKDIDLVMIPSDPWNLYAEIKSLGNLKTDGDKSKHLIINGDQVDVYFATEETWATLLLIRTGSKENNIRLASKAKKQGWHLAASGEGLFDATGERVAGDTKEGIFVALGYRTSPRRGDVNLGDFNSRADLSFYSCRAGRGGHFP